MKLYHGSHTKIREVDLSKGERYRDFGQWFYVTKFRCHAESQAKTRQQICLLVRYVHLT